MLYREVPKNGDKLSVLGYGCMRFPERLGGINGKLAERQMMAAMEKGINYFDTAYPYHSGKSEPFMGKVFARNNCRDRIKLATKLPHWMCGSKADMDRVLDEQLKRLQTDRIDYYLIHALNRELWDTARENGVMEFMDDALKQGKIVRYDVPFHERRHGDRKTVPGLQVCELRRSRVTAELPSSGDALPGIRIKEVEIFLVKRDPEGIPGVGGGAVMNRDDNGGITGLAVQELAGAKTFDKVDVDREPAVCRRD